MTRLSSSPSTIAAVPRGLFYGGRWQEPQSKDRIDVVNPATGDSLGSVADANIDDVDRAVRAARAGFAGWRDTRPLERAKILREAAQRLRKNASSLAEIDALDAGLPVRGMRSDVEIAAATVDFFAGLVTEIKGETIPMGPSMLNYTQREPLGVVARISPFNHPLMFAAGKAAAPLAAGNCVINKPAEQTPLSALALADLWGDLFPPGVFGTLTGRRASGAALVDHPGIAKIGLIGSVDTGRAVMGAASRSLKKLTLELGGKNALIAYADADPKEVAKAAVHGMNLTWTTGQSCGSTSRVFLHEALHDEVVALMVEELGALKLGLPNDPDCQVGCIVSREQHARIMNYIEIGLSEGARLVTGGARPDDDRLRNGFYIQPTLFTDVKASMRIAREEIFGPVISVLRWRDEAAMFEDVNDSEYGLTASIWSRDLSRAHRAASRVEAGYVWVNSVGAHFLGAPYGGYKLSGLGREECLDELLANTQTKNVNVTLA